MKHLWRHTIETGAHAILREVATVVASTARLAIVRGPAGIGKSYGIDLVAEELYGTETRVYVVTATASNGGSIKRFFREAIDQLGLMGGGESEEARFAGYMLRSWPFRKGSARILLIVDECQHLGAKVIETLRGIYDLGDQARNYRDPSAPAFGLLLVGNDRFLTRGGRSERAAFEALATRCPIEWELVRPSTEETAAMAAAMFPEDAACRDAMAAFGERCRTLREMTGALDVAESFAGDGPVALAHLEKAFVLSMGGR